MVLAFENFEHNRKISVRRGGSTFEIGTQGGYSRPYKWGPVYFDVEMTESDWARLATNPLERFMFLDVTNGVPPFRPLLTLAEWRSLIDADKRFPQPVVFGAPWIPGR